ncbi:MAG: DUF2069 domain-containing protein [Burkholderiaceae bacterium]
MADLRRGASSPPPSFAAPDRITAATRIAAAASAVLLIALGIGWELAWAPLGHGTLVVKVVPLLLALPGLLKYRMITYRRLSLAVWLYAAEGALRVGDPWPVGPLAAAELALSIVLFAACATQVRWRLVAAGRRARGGASAAHDPRAGAGTAR